MIMTIEKQECLVSKVNSRLHDDQSLEIQVEDLPNRGEDQRYIQKLEDLIIRFFQNEVIHGMCHEGELNSKSEVFDEKWLFRYIPLSKAMENVRTQKFGIQGEDLDLSS